MDLPLSKEGYLLALAGVRVVDLDWAESADFSEKSPFIEKAKHMIFSPTFNTMTFQLNST